MPYYVYRIDPPLVLRHLETKDRYQDARAYVRGLREAAQSAGEATQYRMIFAHHEAEAERLLSTPHDDRVIGED